MRHLKKTLLALGLLVSGSAAASVTVSASLVITAPYSGAPCNVGSMGAPVTASGNQLYFPVSGTLVYPSGNNTCGGYYVVTLSGATASVVQGPVTPTPSLPCTLTSLGPITASGNQLTFGARGRYPSYPGGPTECFSSFQVTLWGATASVTQGPVTPVAGHPCNLGSLRTLSASGNQLTFPVSGRYAYYFGGPTECASSYIVTFSP